MKALSILGALALLLAQSVSMLCEAPCCAAGCVVEGSAIACCCDGDGEAPAQGLSQEGGAAPLQGVPVRCIECEKRPAPGTTRPGGSGHTPTRPAAAGWAAVFTPAVPPSTASSPAIAQCPGPGPAHPSLAALRTIVLLI
ncbi:MAG: hypothetical protein FJ290_09055 [Planctomycetes bacterium]|nr:hypothetical protein [Planctomycetota bacterium]